MYEYIIYEIIYKIYMKCRVKIKIKITSFGYQILKNFLYSIS